MSYKSRLLYITITACGLTAITTSLYAPALLAARLVAVNDTLSTSTPSLAANHDIRFATASTVPASGKIVFTPEAGAFTIPAGLDYTDIDIAINTVDVPIAATPGTGSGSALGASVVTGTSGSITITLNDTDSLNDSDSFFILIGTNAVVGSAGDQQITNPSSVGSYTETITTKNASNVTIDTSTIQVALVQPVGIDANAPTNSVETPAISPNGGSFITSTSVSISTPTSGADIYYTTDGTAPTTSSNLYVGPFSISTTTTVKAYAVKSGYGDSGLTIATFTISSPPPPPPPPPDPPPPSGGGGGGTPPPPALPPNVVPPANPITGCGSLKADLNCDGRVNLTDLSILLYNWGNVKNNPRADINKDSKVNLVDFSILLYEWTD